jgi:integrase
MASDLRYMKLGRGPGSTWFFVFNVPKDLRGHPRFMTSRGKPMTKITESLGTTDPEKAREARDQRIVYWNRQFRMLLHGPSDDDIREEAVEVFRATLKKQAAERPREQVITTYFQDGTRTVKHVGDELEARWRLGGLKNAVRIVEEARERELFERSGLSSPEQMHVQDIYLAHLDAAIWMQVRNEIADYCQRTGAVLQPETEPYRKVGIEFIEAKIAARDPLAWLPLPDGRKIWGGEQDLAPLPKIEAPIASETVVALPPAKKGAETFGDAFEKYIATELDGTSAESITDYKRKVKVFIDKIGDLPLGKITDHMAVDFLDNYLLGERKVSARTRNGYAMLLSAIFKCAMRRKKATANPFDGQRIKAATVHYEPFTDQELAKLFADAKFEIAPAKHKTGTALPWASLISAFTGCRLEEVAQLKAADIKQTDGIWYFEFCRDGNGKTEAATRIVPLHRALMDAGLLRYRDALGSGSMLFPGLTSRKSKGSKLGPKLGDAFNWWRKQLGIVRPGVNFHSFRHTVGDRLRKAGVSEDDRAALLGHEDERITSRVYGHDGPGLRRLQKIVGAIEYPGLVLPGST